MRAWRGSSVYLYAVRQIFHLQNPHRERYARKHFSNFSSTTVQTRSTTATLKQERSPSPKKLAAAGRVAPHGGPRAHIVPLSGCGGHGCGRRRRCHSCCCCCCQRVPAPSPHRPCLAPAQRRTPAAFQTASMPAACRRSRSCRPRHTCSAARSRRLRTTRTRTRPFWHPRSWSVSERSFATCYSRADCRYRERPAHPETRTPRMDARPAGLLRHIERERAILVLLMRMRHALVPSSSALSLTRARRRPRAPCCGHPPTHVAGTRSTCSYSASASGWSCSTRSSARCSRQRAATATRRCARTGPTTFSCARLPPSQISTPTCCCAVPLSRPLATLVPARTA